MRRIVPFTVIAMVWGVSAYSQMPRNLPGPTNPNRFNQDIEQQRKIEELNNHHDQQVEMQRQVARFMRAIKTRRHLFADFDQVVIHGTAPMTAALLSLISDSPYAADIAYYLNKHPDQAGSIVTMPTEQARQAVQQIEASVSANNPIRKPFAANGS